MKRTTVLIADDSRDLRENLGRKFKEAGCEVLIAAGGQEARQLVESHDVDAMIIDAWLPRGTGVGLLAALATLKKDLAIFVMTASCPFTDAELGEQGARQTFEKPFKLDDVVAKVTAAGRSISAKKVQTPSRTRSRNAESEDQPRPPALNI